MSAGSRPASRRATPSRAVSHCPDNDCQRVQAEALTRIADALESLAPAANTVHDLADRLERLCVFMRKKGPWLLASAPLIASIVGAVIPELGPAVRAIASALAASAAVPGVEG